MIASCGIGWVFRVARYGLRGSGCVLRVARCGVRAAGSVARVTGCALRGSCNRPRRRAGPRN